MKYELLDKIMPALYAILGATISGVTQIIITFWHNRHEKKMARIEKKTIPYQGIYSALIEYRNYFLLFVYGGNEYKKNEDAKNFAPLETNMKFRDEYDKYRLFLSGKLIKKVDTLQERGEALNNLGLLLAGPNYRESDLCAVENESKAVMRLIDICILQIKKELDLI